MQHTVLSNTINNVTTMISVSLVLSTVHAHTHTHTHTITTGLHLRHHYWKQGKYSQLMLQYLTNTLERETSVKKKLGVRIRVLSMLSVAETQLFKEVNSKHVRSLTGI